MQTRRRMPDAIPYVGKLLLGVIALGPTDTPSRLHRFQRILWFEKQKKNLNLFHHVVKNASRINKHWASHLQ